MGAEDAAIAVSKCLIPCTVSTIPCSGARKNFSQIAVKNKTVTSYGCVSARIKQDLDYFVSVRQVNAIQVQVMNICDSERRLPAGI
jgi:hypothetical protein